MAFGPWGNEVSASSRFSGTWITDPDDPANTLVLLRYGGIGRQNARDRAKTALQFVGRSYPVYDTGEARAESVSVDAVLSAEDGDAEEQLALLGRLIGDGEVILYRDGRGRKMYAMGTDFQAEDLDQRSYRVSFLLNRVDFDEVLPEPEPEAPVQVDIQPKNLQATVDQTTRMVLLDWDDVPNTTLYHIFLNGVEVGSTAESATTYGPLEPGEYVFYVTATVAGASSPPSASQGITILPPDGGGGEPPPPVSIVPQNFRAFPQADNRVNLQWDPVTGATEYQVFEIRSPSGVTNGITTSTTMVRGPLADGPFEYWVKAKVNGVWSGESNHQAFTLPYDGGPVGGGDPGGGGGGDPTGTMPSPVDVLGIKNGDAGYLHYNLGVGFLSGHEDIHLQTLEDWSTATRDKLKDHYYTVIDAAGKYAVAMTVDPDGGTTSSNTQYPRTEHRELQQTDTNNANKANWTIDGGDHDFSGFARVMTLPPAKPGICINQLHDSEDDTVMIKTMSLSGKVAMVLDVFGTRVKVLNADYKLGIETWSRIRINNGTLTVYYTESSSSTTSAQTTSTVNYTHGSAIPNSNPPWYHKFGCYAQSNESTDTTGTKCLAYFRDWKQWHTGWPAPVTGNYQGPAGGGGTGLPVVSAGADATVTPGATFSRTAQVTGANISAMGWRIAGGATLSTSASLTWTAPTTAGTTTLEFFATNPTGTATDQVILTVSSTPTGGGGGGSLVYPETFADGTPYSQFGAAQTVINVSGSAALSSALSSAQPGQIITLASGSYSGDFTISGKTGTASQAIIIRAATRLGAVFAAGSSFNINNSKYVTVDGLDFPSDDEGDVLLIRGNSSNVQYRRCRVGPASFSNKSTVGNYVYVGDDVKHFRIGYCTLRNKGTSGNIIRIYGNFTSYVGCQYGRIDHNLIDTAGDEVGNDKEAIRAGVSTMSRTVANITIERNHIRNVKAEPEVISGKMANVIQRGNIVEKCAGGIVIRHGRNCKQQSNYVIDRVNTTATAGLKSGGSRFYDSGHVIEDNYFDGLASTANFQRPIIVDTGDAGGTSTNLSAHWNVVDCIIQRNVIRNCPSGIHIGDNYSTAPANTSVLNNDVINSGGAAVTTITPMTGDSPVTGNVHYASDAAGGYTVDAAGIYRKSGRGPKVTYLTAADVGVTGDPDETDRTGVSV